MKIADENNVVISDYCGDRTGKEFVMGGNYAVITMHTSDVYGDSLDGGFRITFVAVQPRKYKLTIVGKTKHLISGLAEQRTSHGLYSSC